MALYRFNTIINEKFSGLEQKVYSNALLQLKEKLAHKDFYVEIGSDHRCGLRLRGAHINGAYTGIRIVVNVFEFEKYIRGNWVRQERPDNYDLEFYNDAIRIAFRENINSYLQYYGLSRLHCCVLTKWNFRWMR